VISFNYAYEKSYWLKFSRNKTFPKEHIQPFYNPRNGIRYAFQILDTYLQQHTLKLSKIHYPLR